MGEQVRTAPEVITFDGGIKSDSPLDTADFADMVNLTPPPDGSAGVIPRHPVRAETEGLYLGFPLVNSRDGLVHRIEPVPDVEPNGVKVGYYSVISVASDKGQPLALFPVFDVINSLPGEWEDARGEYRPGEDIVIGPPIFEPPYHPPVGPIEEPQPQEWIRLGPYTNSWVYITIPPLATTLLMSSVGANPSNPIRGNIYYEAPNGATSWAVPMEFTTDVDREIPLGLAPNGQKVNKIRIALWNTVIHYGFGWTQP